MSEFVKYWIEIIHSKVGTGDTAKSAVMENFWLAEPQEDGSQIKMNLLNDNYEPTGYVEMVSTAALSQRFTPLPADYIPPRKDPDMIRVDQITARAERHLSKKEYNSAEYEFSNALKINEQSVRANFGLGQTYLGMGEVEKAKQVFSKLATIDEMMSLDNKHIFNEFGMQLRKLGMFKEASEHYEKAIQLSPGDENLWFNKGRSLFEEGNTKEAVEALRMALQINADFTDAKQFILYMKQNMSKTA